MKRIARRKEARFAGIVDQTICVCDETRYVGSLLYACLNLTKHGCDHWVMSSQGIAMFKDKPYNCALLIKANTRPKTTWGR